MLLNDGELEPLCTSSHGEQTGKMLIEIEKVMIKEKPDIVVTSSPH